MNFQEDVLKPSISFQFSNVGPVRDATLELGDITIVSGRNNTGKTVTAYLIYGFLKEWDNWPLSGSLHGITGFSEVDVIREELTKEHNCTISLSESNIVQYRKIMAKKVSAAWSLEIHRVFKSNRGSFCDARISVNLENVLVTPSPYVLKLEDGNIRMRYDKGRVITEFTPGRHHFLAHPNASAHCFFHFLMRDIFPVPFFLSAERLGVSLHCRELDSVKRRILESQDDSTLKGGNQTSDLSVDDGTSLYAVPIKDNIDFSRNVSDLSKHSSPLEQHNLHHGVEKMMQGRYGCCADDIHFIPNTQEENQLRLPLHLASSSVRGLSDLCVFLRHIADVDRLLIIEEPESHLDTANQVKFATLLSRFVNAGLRVLITTHSDYILKELNNLIMLSREFPEKQEVARKLDYRAEDALQPERVSAYVAENGGLTACRIGPFGIEAPVFDDTIDAINLRSIELASRMPVQNRE